MDGFFKELCKFDKVIWDNEGRGVIVVKLYGEEALVDKLYVNAQFRDKGIAQNLGMRAEEWAAANGAKCLSCVINHVNAEAQAGQNFKTFLKFGFVPYEVESGLLIMKKDIVK